MPPVVMSPMFKFAAIQHWVPIATVGYDWESRLSTSASPQVKAKAVPGKLAMRKTAPSHAQRRRIGPDAARPRTAGRGRPAGRRD